MQKFALLPLAMFVWHCKKPVTVPQRVPISQVCDKKYAPKLVQGLYVGPRLAVQGYLTIEGEYAMVSSTILLKLHEHLVQKGAAVSVSLPYNNGPNSVVDLPEKYQAADLRVQTQTGEFLEPSSRVELLGKRLGGDDGAKCLFVVDTILAAN
jgi:hypothetical protein